MAHYDIAHTCGHIERVDLFGKYTDRNYRISRLQQQACPACRAKKANEDAAANGLPLLSGSDAQIVWANDIREQFRANFKALEDRIKTATKESRAKVENIARAYYEVTISQNSRAWIDNCDSYYNDRAILRDMNDFAKKCS